MTTTTMEGEHMTDHQMDTILAMVLTMFRALDPETFEKKLLSLIKDEAIKEESSKKDN